MTTPAPENQVQDKANDKEYNFRALEGKFQKQQELLQRQLDQERAARMEAERVAQERIQAKEVDEDNDDEPYVDKKKLEKKFSMFEKKMEERIDKRAEEKARHIIGAQKNENWLKQNADFYEVMQHAEKFAQKDPELAEAILEMPEGFERQKLVYKNIKALGLHKPEVKQSSIQEKVNANQRNPYYQPSGVGSAPYASVSDFSPAGQKQAYDKMKELKARIGV